MVLFEGAVLVLLFGAAESKLSIVGAQSVEGFSIPDSEQLGSLCQGCFQESLQDMLRRMTNLVSSESSIFACNISWYDLSCTA